MKKIKNSFIFQTVLIMFPLNSDFCLLTQTRIDDKNVRTVIAGIQAPLSFSGDVIWSQT